MFKLSDHCTTGVRRSQTNWITSANALVMIGLINTSSRDMKYAKTEFMG